MPKKIVTMVLFFSLFFMLLTALVMFIVPPGRVASWANWNFLGLSRQAWEGAHMAMGLLFLGSGVAHLLLHLDDFLDHLRDEDGVVVVFTKPFLIGLLLTAGVFAASLAGLPPAGQLVALSGLLKERAAETYGEPPYSQAERSTLADFARRMGMDAEKALSLLRLRNIKAENADLTLAEIARQNHVAPGGVFEALKMVMEPSGGTITGLPKDPPPGLGRRKLSDICEEYGLDMVQVLSRLSAAGYKAQPAWTLTETAKANNVLPIAVYDALRTDKGAAPVPVEVASPVELTKQPGIVPVETPPAAAQPAPLAHAPAQTPALQPPAAGQPVQQSGLQAAAPGATGSASAPGYASNTPAPAPGYAPNTPAPGYAPGQAPSAAGYAAIPTGHLPAAPGYAPTAPGYPPVSAVPPTAAGPAAPPPGLEKMMLQSFCREYEIPLSVAVQRLAKHRITAFGDMSFGELALENNRTPADIMRLVVSQ